MRGFIEAVVPARLGTSYRWLLGSSWTTNLGDGIAMAAGPLLVASLTTDPFLVALAALLRWAPPLLFGLTAGVLSDRLNRRRIVMTANTFRGLVLGGLVTVMLTGHVTAGLALLALGLLSAAEVFADNTSATLAPMLVRREDLAIANARIQTGFLTLNQLAGPPIGGVLATRYGVTAPFWFAFVGSAIFVAVLWRQMTHIAHADEHPDGGQRSTMVTHSADLGL